ncbi:MAG: hypothetical protein GY805_06290 [Chloroflexi bacterium]|nr:hypothetical protein [Chloroflexota bacterium]
MSDFQRFLKNLSDSDIPLEERVQEFRHETLRPLHLAIGYAELLQKETEGCPELPEKTKQDFQNLLYHLDEMQQLLDALIKRPDDGDSE